MTVSQELPPVLQQAVNESGALGETTRSLTETALRRLWFDAVSLNETGHLFLSTGDIDAMWIRDSTWQVRPILRFSQDATVKAFIGKVIATQAFYLDLDPYANAFNRGPNGQCWHKDFPDQSPWVFERKFELDSITGFWQLSLDFADASSSAEHLNDSWWSLTERLVGMLWQETHHDPKSYIFFRPKNPTHDSLSNEGKGAPFADCGLIWSGFRPSDDGCELPFLIPSNIHASLLLKRIASLAVAEHPALGESCELLAKQLDQAIETHAWFTVDGNRVLAYEIDGLGGSIIMDDANYPNLLSLSFLGHPDAKLASQMRAFSLSSANPWFFDNGRAAGLGSPHTGSNMIWPLALAMAGITADTQDERLACLRLIEETALGGAIHESFSIEDPRVFTREWFSWAEMTYFELVMQTLETNQVRP